MPHRDDHAWFTDDVAVHLDAVYRYFVRRAPRTDADDLCAEVFATAWRRRADVPRGGELPWLYRTAGFVLANHRRRAHGMPLRAVDEPDASGSDHADRVADRDRLARALAALGERDREILLLHAWDGLDGTELGEALGVSRSGAQAALSRARARLREIWRLQDIG
ncbi:RNA polymerase sigma factor [Microbacterium sp. No. 7]|uniref:RNA polymerase sigma factor n=1 Tax=Microbacterium sp. No. 7 TaxID=1714373 RepID=UPI0006D0F031|nr:sigma-70 family RNA polymerase sigma factor [Microbacterium sp. No. 7]ALJ19131.1 RNA polymerase [Microbacterium sp. No. 7]